MLFYTTGTAHDVCTSSLSLQSAPLAHTLHTWTNATKVFDVDMMQHVSNRCIQSHNPIVGQWHSTATKHGACADHGCVPLPFAPTCWASRHNMGLPKCFVWKTWFEENMGSSLRLPTIVTSAGTEKKDKNVWERWSKSPSNAAHPKAHDMCFDNTTERHNIRCSLPSQRRPGQRRGMRHLVSICWSQALALVLKYAAKQRSENRPMSAITSTWLGHGWSMGHKPVQWTCA